MSGRGHEIPVLPDEDFSYRHLSTLGEADVAACIDDYLDTDPLTNSTRSPAKPRACPPPPGIFDLYSDVDLEPYPLEAPTEYDPPGLGTRVRTFSQSLLQHVHAPPHSLELPESQELSEELLDDGDCPLEPRGVLRIDFELVDEELRQHQGSFSSSATSDSGHVTLFDPADFVSC